MEQPRKSISDVRKGLEQRKKKATKVDSVPNPNRSRRLENVLKDSKDLEFNCTSVCRIDDDLHDIFTRLKNKKGVRIGRVISVILKDFIEDNADQIKKILQENKYL